jgi:bifunctional UDP-N-acetylglucosamine pyrophosphorylase / glucosamine-1-phosphate N-acetyltransferase
MGLAVVILAAGQGKRMHSDLPKVLQPLAGRPLLGYVLDTAAALGAASVHVVYGHGGERVKAAFPGRPVQWVLQAEQHGTGHAVAQALPAIADDDRVLVLYGDVPLIRVDTLKSLIAAGGPATVALLSVELEDPSGYGRVLRDKAGTVYRVVEERDATRKERAVREANTGVLCAPAGLLRRLVAALGNDNAQHEYYLTDVVTLAVKDGARVVAERAGEAAEVCGVNDREQLAAVESALRDFRARELMSAGVTVVDPTRLDVRGRVQAGRDVVLDVNVVLEGEIVLGDGARVGPGCVLKDSVVGAGSEILAYSVLDGARVGAQCRVGPYSRLRPGAALADGVHVGNFVEIKNASLGERAKANHLTYLGDAQVGADVNVGAGTITCNYDGVNKWRTVIEPGAFIGSGAMLVAPVTVGANATIGAGSTITRPAPPDQLTLERSRQQTVPGWRRPEAVSAEERARREAAAKAEPTAKPRR